MGYLFVGVQGVDGKGDNVIIQSYFTPDGEDSENIVDVLAQTKALADELKLNIKQVVSGNGGAAPAAAVNGDREVVKIGSFAIRMQQNIDKNTHEVTETPAVVLYPLWNRDGTFGKFSVTTAFLNFPEDVEAFENWLASVGVNQKLNDFPVYDGEGSPPRTLGVTKKWEVVLPKTALIEVSHSTYKKADDTEGKRTKIVRWITD